MRKYSEKFINDSDILKKARIGFEFEFYMKDLSYYKTLELLNQYLSPVKAWGFKQYHSKFEPDRYNFKIETDLSGGANMLELVTGPMTYFDAKYYLIKLLKFIQEYGYTNERSSVHFNLSFNESSDKNLNDLNVLKLILKTDEDEIYRAFPNRKDNVYAKTVKKIIPYKEYDFNNIPIDIVKNNLRLPADKYYGINFLHINEEKEKQRLEYRYIGGKDYEKNIGLINYFMDKFIINTYNSIDAGFDNDDIEALEFYLEKNITNFKNFSKYDSFLVEFPTIQLQIDQQGGYDIVSAYYQKLYWSLFTLIDSTENIDNCIINYVTTTKRLEIVDSTIKAVANINDLDFINCTISDAIMESCNLVTSHVNNCQLVKTRLDGCQVKESKLLSCKAESSNLENCFFMNGYLNSEMDGGVYRSGELGPYASISPETKIVKDTDNFFDTAYGEDTGYVKSKDKGVMDFKK